MIYWLTKNLCLVRRQKPGTWLYIFDDIISGLANKFWMIWIDVNRGSQVKSKYTFANDSYTIIRKKNSNKTKSLLVNMYVSYGQEKRWKWFGLVKKKNK